MECPVCFDEGVTQGHECTTCNRITCCSKCYEMMPRKMCPLCRKCNAPPPKWAPGDFGFIRCPDTRLAVELTYKSGMRAGVFDMNPNSQEWEQALFDATEEDCVGHSGGSWMFAIHHIRRMRDIGSWAGYVQWYQQAR